MADKYDWKVIIGCSRSFCIFLINGLHGKQRENSKYECDLLQNQTGLCEEKSCPIRDPNQKGGIPENPEKIDLLSDPHPQERLKNALVEQKINLIREKLPAMSFVTDDELTKTFELMLGFEVRSDLPPPAKPAPAPAPQGQPAPNAPPAPPQGAEPKPKDAIDSPYEMPPPEQVVQMGEVNDGLSSQKVWEYKAGRMPTDRCPSCYQGEPKGGRVWKCPVCGIVHAEVGYLVSLKRKGQNVDVKPISRQGTAPPPQAQQPPQQPAPYMPAQAPIAGVSVPCSNCGAKGFMIQEGQQVACPSCAGKGRVPF